MVRKIILGVNQGHFKEQTESILYLAYRLTDAEIRVGDSKDIRENEICAVISKRPKGMYHQRSFRIIWGHLGSREFREIEF